VGAGADFPAMLAEMQIEGSVKTLKAYKPEVYARNLKNDLQWYEQVLRGDVPRGFRGPWENKLSLVIDALRIFSPSHILDVERWYDPVPGIHDLRKIAQSYIHRINDILLVRKQLQEHKLMWTSGKAQKALRNSKKILFMCYGNINRSALAERYFRQINPHSKVEAISAGFHHEENRPADPTMIEETKKVGIDMENWSSSRVTEEMLASSDVILVMENEHWQQIKAEFPKYTHKTYLLGYAGSPVPHRGEIRDPYGKSRKIYQNAIVEISNSINGLSNILNKQ
jgi:protein-tyrosine-phosphatase